MGRGYSLKRRIRERERASIEKLNLPLAFARTFAMAHIYTTVYTYIHRIYLYAQHVITAQRDTLIKGERDALLVNQLPLIATHYRHHSYIHFAHIPPRVARIYIILDVCICVYWWDCKFRNCDKFLIYIFLQNRDVKFWFYIYFIFAQKSINFKRCVNIYITRALIYIIYRGIFCGEEMQCCLINIPPRMVEEREARVGFWPASKGSPSHSRGYTP